MPSTARPLADRYDIVAIAIVIAATLIGGLAAGDWWFGFLVGAAVGNGTSWALRRHAGIPDRSPLGALVRAWQRHHA
jgi:hypothetical protein